MYVVFFPFPWLLHTEMCETCTNYTEPKEQDIYIEKDVWENSSWEFWHWNLKTSCSNSSHIFRNVSHMFDSLSYFAFKLQNTGNTNKKSTHTQILNPNKETN